MQSFKLPNRDVPYSYIEDHVQLPPSGWYRMSLRSFIAFTCAKAISYAPKQHQGDTASHGASDANEPVSAGIVFG